MYPAKIIEVDNGLIITFRDIPEATTWVDSYDNVRKVAERSLLIAVELYADSDRIVPSPNSQEDGEILISLPASVAAKVLLLNTMIEQRVSQVKLADLMGIQRQQITRLVDLKHTTKLDALQKTLNFLGKGLSITLTEHPDKQPLTEEDVNTINEGEELNLPDEIKFTSTVGKLAPIYLKNPELRDKPNPFTRKSQYEVIRLLTDAIEEDSTEGAKSKVYKSGILGFLVVLTPILTLLARNSVINYEPRLYEHHFDLLELERLAYNSGNDYIPDRPVAALKDFLLSLPDYDINKIGSQSSKTNEAFGFIVMQLMRDIKKYI